MHSMLAALVSLLAVTSVGGIHPQRRQASTVLTHPSPPSASPPPPPAPPASAPPPSAPSPASPSPPPPAAPAPTHAPSGSAPVFPAPGSSSGLVTGNVSASSPPTFPVNIPSTNPTAIPLASIVASAPPQATVPLATTYPAGAIPTSIPNAPPLPDISALNPANYPPLDKPPPLDSPSVQAAIAQVKSSGFTIPDLSPNQVGGCPANPAAAADASRCWWTCSQCSRPTDVITCPDKLTWGSSFDDGPSPYTPSLTQYLDQQQIKSTFFVVGSRVISRPLILRTQYMSGNQISVHTWSHTPLTTQTTEEIIAEFYWSKKVIKDVLGVTPNTMRPPFGDIDDRVRAIAAAMGLTPIIWTSGTSSNHISYDTKDFFIPAGNVSASESINTFSNLLKNASTLATGFIVLEHDLFQQSVDVATGYTIPEALALNFTLKPIIKCLNKNLADAYIETNDNATNPPPFVVGTSIAGGPVATPSAGATGSHNGAAVISIRSWGPVAFLFFSILGSVVAL